MAAAAARRRARRAASLALYWLLASPGLALAIPVGPPGATTGDSGSPAEGLALSADAQEQTGAARTRVPIEVPPGRSGLQPELALVYSSHGDAGLYGAGWDVPIGRIERSTRMGVPYYDGRDRFVVILPAGAEEVVAIGTNTYAARVDSVHFVATANDPANSWTVHDRSGRDYVFGATPPSRVGPDPAIFDTTFAWHLTQIRDLNGNTLDVTYTSASGHAYPDRIAYGGRVGSPAHPYRISFRWEERAPEATRLSFAAGFRRDTLRYLSSIEVTFGSRRVRTYELVWQPSPANGRPLLAEIRLRGSSGQLFPGATIFSYHDYPLPPTAPGDPSFADVRPEDLGPGANAFRDADLCGSRDFLDLNGDGRADFVRTRGWEDQNGKRNWEVLLNQGAGAAPLFGDPVPWAAPFGCLVDRDPENFETLRAIVDMNGDALPDYVNTNVSPWKVYLNTGAGFATPATQSWDPNPYDPAQTRLTLRAGTAATGAVHRDLVDLNGDGCPELVDTTGWASTHQWWVWWNNCSSFGGPDPMDAPSEWIRVGGPDTPDRNIASDRFDINGDGLPDKVTAEGRTWWVSYGTGRGPAAPAARSPPRAREWPAGRAR